MGQFMMNLQEAASWTRTTVEQVREALEVGKLEGETTGGGILYITFASLCKWKEELYGPKKSKLKKHNEAARAARKRRELSKSEIEADEVVEIDTLSSLHEIFDPELYDHQIPDYEKYDRHSEESYNDQYDIYDDGDPARYE